MGDALRRALAVSSCVALIIVLCLGVLSTVPAIRKSVWTKVGEAIVPGPVDFGSVDYYGTASPDIRQVANGTYVMWYTGYVEMNIGITNAIVGQISIATSLDGLQWTKHGVVLGVDEPPWDFVDISSPRVLQEGSVYQMWFNAYQFNAYQNRTPSQIYHAQSENGVNWTVEGVALGLGSIENPNIESFTLGSVVSMPGGGYRMYYNLVESVGTGFNRTSRYTIWTASSSNGSVFGPVGNAPVFAADPTSGWDCEVVRTPRVSRGSPWTMYYTGGGPCAPKGFSTNGIGVATSMDGLNWIRSPDNPLIGPSSDISAFDGEGVSDGFVVATSSGPLLYYTGSSDVQRSLDPWWSIGVAAPGTTTIPIISLDPLVTDACLVFPPLLAFGAYLEIRHRRRLSKPLAAEEPRRGPRLRGT